jgi:hypothetical protein
MFKIILNDRSLYNLAVLLLLILDLSIPSQWDKNKSHHVEAQFILNLNCIKAHIAKDADTPLTQQTNKYTSAKN